MNREILFKAKRIYNGEWVEGNLLQTTAVSLKSFIVPTSCYTFDKWDWAEWLCVDTDTICQYTGLTDKDGNKIWENDIVAEDWGNFKGIVRFGEFENQVLKNVGFNIDWLKKSIYYRQDLPYWSEKSDVIGNIFDNPEILEGGAEE